MPSFPKLKALIVKVNSWFTSQEYEKGDPNWLSELFKVLYILMHCALPHSDTVHQNLTAVGDCFLFFMFTHFQQSFLVFSCSFFFLRISLPVFFAFAVCSLVLRFPSQVSQKIILNADFKHAI